ncbi:MULTISPECIES: response regulator [unclassified Pseudoxanthomonas]|uniref:response regulator n=1 Tax=unclassified Pseudoxanthomonas TaxID=2645906 RepID=UPI0016101E08|nr:MULTISPECIES: response regulator [unclassified Pseudoxanthomonas]MBB3274817.1 DNA-binding NtrC family response regulator [Pseudoxanthomonas sp. OG2]MBD9378343.1 response regulator [Pseudoxanthomonas sp. PXM04]MBV7475291.1 response regulator [Pseudoxanthomonas sp. PXM05]
MEKVRRVLFVEDEPDIAEVVADALSSEGFEVCVAANGRDALELLHTGIPFDSVITDVSMPDGVSGIDVAHEAARLNPAAKIIVASGHQLGHLPQLPERFEFIPKPYRLMGLLNAIS